MGNDDRVLSQAEIDALLSNTAPNTPAAKTAPAMPTVQQIKVTAAPPPPKVVSQQPKAPPPPPPKGTAPTPAPQPEAPVAPAAPAAPAGPTPDQVANLCRQIIAEETKDLQKMVQDLQKTEIELTVKVNKLNSDTQRMDQLEDKIDELTAVVKSSPKAIRALEARIVEIYGLLDTIRQHSDEDHIHDEFKCVNCQSKKLVAIHVKCTSCGTENWMGWFPDSKGK